MSRKGTTYSRLQAFREKLQANPWFASLGLREQLLLLHTLAVKMEARTIDIIEPRKEASGRRLTRDRLRAKVVQSIWSAR